MKFTVEGRVKKLQENPPQEDIFLTAMVFGEIFGAIANIAQVIGIDCGMLTRRMMEPTHEKIYEELEGYLELVHTMLDQCKRSHFQNKPKTRHATEQLEMALRRADELLKTYQDRSWFYLFLKRRQIDNHFRLARDNVGHRVKLLNSVMLLHHDQLQGGVQGGVGGNCDCADFSNLSKNTMSMVVTYLKKHCDKVITEEDLRAWDTKFLNVDEATLFNLYVVGNFLFPFITQISLDDE